MEAAASAAVAAAKEAALAASAAASAAEKEAAVVAATAKEAAAASAAAVAAKEAALAASAATSAAANKAEVAAVTASEAAATAKEAAVVASAAASNAKEAAAVAATTGEVAAAAAAAATAAMQASKKRKFHLICDQDPPGSGSCDDVDGGSVDLSNDVDGGSVDLSNDVDGGSVDLSDDVDGRSVDPIDDVDVGIVDLTDDVDGGSVDLSDDVHEESVDLISYFDLGSADLISRLPDAVLCSIVSLLPTKEGARTQVISCRWRPLWRSAPLNLVVDRNTIDLVPKILSEHRGPARRFSIEDCYDKVKGYTPSIYIEDCYDKIEGWLSSDALDNLQELELTPKFAYRYRGQLYLLPLPAYRFSPTLRVAKFHCFHFPNLIVQLSLKFPCLKQLTLQKVTISEDPLQSLLSGCTALESLELKENMGTGRLCITSQTLKSLGFYADSMNGGLFLQELVIKDAPCLERLLPLNPKRGTASIRIISAPKLEILDMLSEDTYEFHLGSSVFQKMIAVSLTTKMHTMRVLVLSPSSPKLDAVVNFLKCFPCLERLYVIFQSGDGMNNVRKYDPLDPLECLELHLKKVVLKNYDGTRDSSINFAKFFVLNAKVLKEMKISLPYHRQRGWVADQSSLLRVRNRASRDARIEMRCGTKDDFTHNRHIHDLSMDGPFDLPYGGCYKCEEKGLGGGVYQI
ncbi:hypothetical protein ACQJBY_003102 [Aegilops geniculata]